MNRVTEHPNTPLRTTLSKKMARSGAILTRAPKRGLGKTKGGGGVASFSSLRTMKSQSVRTIGTRATHTPHAQQHAWHMDLRNSKELCVALRA